ncbi:autotransporter-associated beta strand repeat-containing protein [Geminisphaera colitermitum]|uniref:autotransporter-associated beta strand repeat-containing protein n=1 Tax=Geminisphaera colitermitum TaxID=1148786 RepID=UPI000158CF5A|nr:autotransporter-associated beta strand repeat-containing protein [Geminisphaera colitermitum]
MKAQKLLPPALLPLLLIASAICLSATTYQWNNDATSSNWSTVTNWSPNGTPGEGDTISTPIKAGAALVNVDVSVHGMDIGSGWTLRGTGGTEKTLTIGEGGLIKSGSGTLLIRNDGSASSITFNVITSSITVSDGSLSFGSGTNPLSSLNVSGTTTVGASGTLPLYVLDANLAGGLENDGVVGLNAGPDASTTVLTVGGITGSGEIRVGSAASTRKSTLIVSLAAGEKTFAGKIINGGTGTTLTLEKNGAGTQILSGNTNTYSGGTTIDKGSLLVANTSGSGVGTGAVAVKNDATFGGTGIVALAAGNAITVESGGTLLGGDGASLTGVLTIANDVTLQTGSTIRLTFGAGGTHSSIARTGGTWNFANDQSIFFDNINDGAQTGVVYTGIITGLAADPGVSGWTIANAGWTGIFSYANGSVSVVLSTAIPEPASIATLLAAAAVLATCCICRRRRHSIR